MRALVTGSAGHLREGLVRTLRERGHRVTGLDILASSFTDHVGSVADPQFVLECTRGVDVVIHAARQARDELGWRPRVDFRHALDSLRAGRDVFGPLMRLVGSKRYYSETLDEGPYPVESPAEGPTTPAGGLD